MAYIMRNMRWYEAGHLTSIERELDFETRFGALGQKVFHDQARPGKGLKRAVSDAQRKKILKKLGR